MSGQIPFMSALTSLVFFGAARGARQRHTLFWIAFATRIEPLVVKRKRACRIGERTQP